MSRILRRPMFRGGRVDSRGTGITSGLSYAKGGSVNTPKRGLVNEPGGYAGENPGFMKSDIYKGGRWLLDYLGKPVSNVVGEFAVNPVAGLFGYPNLYEQMETPYDYADAKLWNYFGGGKHPIYNPDGDFSTDDTIANKIWADRYKEMPEVTTAKGPPGGGETSRGSGEAYYKEPKVEKKTLEEMMKDMMGPQKTAKEKVAEYKEIFKDAYGSGVADDASTMALSLAGKMLKPEATVKSGFGEFFEEESKRPSESKKYKDAATTAAINAYLTGESSFQKFEDQLKLAKAGMDIKLEAGRPKTLNEAFTYFMKTGDDATDPGIMARSVEAIYGDNTFGGKFPEDPTKLIIGNVYYADDPNNSSNKILFLIDENREPQPIKTVYK